MNGSNNDWKDNRPSKWQWRWWRQWRRLCAFIDWRVGVAPQPTSTVPLNISIDFPLCAALRESSRKPLPQINKLAHQCITYVCVCAFVRRAQEKYPTLWFCVFYDARPVLSQKICPILQLFTRWVNKTILSERILKRTIKPTDKRLESGHWI